MKRVLRIFLKETLKANKISFHNNFETIRDAEIILIAVGTPSREDGSANLDALFSAMESSLPYFRENVRCGLQNLPSQLELLKCLKIS